MDENKFDLMAVPVDDLNAKAGMVFLAPTSPPSRAELVRAEPSPVNSALRTITVRVLEGPMAGQEVPYNLVEGQPCAVSVESMPDGAPAPVAPVQAPAPVAPAPVAPAPGPVPVPPAPQEAVAPGVVPMAPEPQAALGPVPVAPDAQDPAPEPVAVPTDTPTEEVQAFIRTQAATSDGSLTVSGLRASMKAAGITVALDGFKSAVAALGLEWDPYNLTVSSLVDGPTQVDVAEAAETAVDSIADHLGDPEPEALELEALEPEAPAVVKEPEALEPEAPEREAWDLEPGEPVRGLSESLEVLTFGPGDGPGLLVPFVALEREGGLKEWLEFLEGLEAAGFLSAEEVKAVVYTGGPRCNR